MGSLPTRLARAGAFPVTPVNRSSCRTRFPTRNKRDANRTVSGETAGIDLLRFAANHAPRSRLHVPAFAQGSQNITSSQDQRCFLDPDPAFQLAFARESGGLIERALDEDQADDFIIIGMLRAPAGLMLPDAASNIVGCTDVKGTIGAEEHVDEEAGDRRWWEADGKIGKVAGWIHQGMKRTRRAESFTKGDESPSTSYACSGHSTCRGIAGPHILAPLPAANGLP
jgi:hypothetical protein